MTDVALKTIKDSVEAYATHSTALSGHRYDADTKQTVSNLMRGKDAFSEFLNSLGPEDAERCKGIALSYVPFGRIKSRLQRNARTSTDKPGIVNLDLNDHFLTAALSSSGKGVGSFVVGANEKGWEAMFDQVAKAQNRPKSDYTNSNAYMSGYQAKLREHYLPAIASALMAKGTVESDQWYRSWAKASDEEVFNVARSSFVSGPGQPDPTTTPAMGEVTLGPLSRQAMTVDWLNAKAKEYSDELKIAGVEAPKIVMMKDQEATLSSQLSSVELKAGWESTLDLYPLLVKSAELNWKDEVVVSVKEGEEYKDSVWPPKYEGTGGETAETAAAE